MPVTIKDVARRVGKSITTVSRALNDYDDVSPETKALVRRVAAEMGYTPNRTAQRLQKRRSDTIGLVLPTYGPRFSDPFFSEFLAGIGNQTADFGYDLLVSTRAPGDEEMEAYRRKVQGQQVDGLIVVRTRQQDPRVDYLRRIGFPFVAFGRVQGTLDFPFVDVDGEEGMRQLVHHLAELGHRRIAYITPPSNLNFAQDRMTGFQAAMAQHGLPLDPELVVEGELTHRSGYQQTQRLLALADPPTAIVAGNDLMALGAMRAAQEIGLKVGPDIAIAGFDNIPMAEHAHPPLTTVDQPIYTIGRMLSAMLIRLIRQEEVAEQQVLLQPSLVVRQSSAPGARPGEGG